MQSATPMIENITNAPPMGLQNRVVDAGMRALEQTSFMSGKNPLHVKNNLIQLLGKADLTQNDLVFLKSISDKTFHSLRVLKDK